MKEGISMYHLTPDQYDTFSIAAHNLCVLAQGDKYCHWHIDQLAEYTAVLTGTYPSQKLLYKALEKARSYEQDDSRANCDALIELFIGPFDYQPFSKDQLKAQDEAREELKACLLEQR